MTLVEILVVIVLIGLIMGVVGGRVLGKGDEAKAKLNVTKMETLSTSIERYRLEFNSYPAKLEDLMTASADIKRDGKIFTPFVQEDELKDIWGYPYIYRVENNQRSYSLSSLGSDGIEGGDGAKQDVTKRP